MQFDEIDEEYFQEQINQFVEKHGGDALKDIYRLHRNLSKTLFIKNLPTVEIFRRIFFDDFERELKSRKSLNEIAVILSEREGISKRTVYDYYHQHYPRIKKLRKSSANKI